MIVLNARKSKSGSVKITNIIYVIVNDVALIYFIHRNWTLVYPVPF